MYYEDAQQRLPYSATYISPEVSVLRKGHHQPCRVYKFRVKLCQHSWRAKDPQIADSELAYSGWASTSRESIVSLERRCASRAR